MIPSGERDGFHFTYCTLKMLHQLQSLSCCNRSVNTQIFHLYNYKGKKQSCKKSLTADVSYTGWSGFGQKNLGNAVHKPVAIINFGSDFLFQLLELILGQGPGEDLGSPLNQVVNHVPDTAEHLPVVLLLWGQKRGEFRFEGLGMLRINCNSK